MITVLPTISHSISRIQMSYLTLLTILYSSLVTVSPSYLRLLTTAIFHAFWTHTCAYSSRQMLMCFLLLHGANSMAGWYDIACLLLTDFDMASMLIFTVNCCSRILASNHGELILTVISSSW